MRSRTTDQRVTTTIKYRDDTATGQPTYPPYNNWAVINAPGFVGMIKSIDDEPHYGYTHRKERGELMMGNLSISTTSRTMSEGTMSGHVTEWNETLTRTGDLISEAEAAIDPLITDYGNRFHAQMAEIAIVKAYAKMKQSDVMGGEVLSDLDRTVGMLRRPFGSSVQLLHKMRVKKAWHLKKKSATLAQAASNAWLEYRYGWQPIILDCKAVVKASHEFHERFGGRLVARGSCRDIWDTSKSFTNLEVVSGYYWPRYFTGTVHSTEECAAHAGVIYDVASRTTTEQLRKMLGGRSADIMPLVWEKIPYSFVADWFVNVGDWLQAITPDPYTSVRASWVTVKRKCIANVSATVICHPTPTSPLTGDAGTSSTTWDTVYRTANPSVPSLPTATNRSLSRLHQVDSMALMVRPIIDGLSSFFSRR